MIARDVGASGYGRVVTELRLVNVPIDSLGIPGGTALMPDALGASGLAGRVRPDVTIDVPVRDAVQERGPGGYLAEATFCAVSEILAEVLKGEDRVSLVIGGDCSVLIGALVSLGTSGQPGLVFVDGHEDSWPPEASSHGEVADSELGIALGIVSPPPGLALEVPLVDRSRTLVLGPRDAEELEQNAIPRVDAVATMRDDRWVRSATTSEVTRLVRTTVAGGPWWFHVDLDVLSTEALSAIDYPQPGGLSWDQLERLTSTAIEIGGCLGASVVIYNPELDDGRAAPRIVDYCGLIADLLRGN
jgi:arginase